MKKLKLALIVLFFPAMAFCQVFNTASTLAPGKFSLGVNPVVYDNDFGLFLHGGVGIKPGVDLAMRYGFLEGEDYFGADIEWRLLGGGKPGISLITGAHKYWRGGLDLGLNISFPITSGVSLYTGLDMDINFWPDNTIVPVWLPVGVEIPLKSNISFMFEAEIPLSDEARSIFGGGLAFYF
ncbi:MAG TPA: hypothetical protein VHO72_13235 [Bacteroidales bacterium]|nr:hypothetical protein [Bacteroidales bacterium]